MAITFTDNAIQVHIPAEAIEALSTVWHGMSYAILGAMLAIIVMVAFTVILKTTWTYWRELFAFVASVAYVLVYLNYDGAPPDGFIEALFLFLCSMTSGAVALAIAYLNQEVRQERINLRLATERRAAIQQRIAADAAMRGICRA